MAPLRPIRIKNPMAKQAVEGTLSSLAKAKVVEPGSKQGFDVFRFCGVVDPRTHHLGLKGVAMFQKPFAGCVQVRVGIQVLIALKYDLRA